MMVGDVIGEIKPKEETGQWTLWLNGERLQESVRFGLLNIGSQEISVRIGAEWADRAQEPPKAASWHMSPETAVTRVRDPPDFAKKVDYVMEVVNGGANSSRCKSREEVERKLREMSFSADAACEALMDEMSEGRSRRQSGDEAERPLRMVLDELQKEFPLVERSEIAQLWQLNGGNIEVVRGVVKGLQEAEEEAKKKAEEEAKKKAEEDAMKS
jgi:hypothetical protein